MTFAARKTGATSDNEASTLAIAGWALYAATWGPVTLTGGGGATSTVGLPGRSPLTWIGVPSGRWPTPASTST